MINSVGEKGNVRKELEYVNVTFNTVHYSVINNHIILNSFVSDVQ